MSKVLHVKKDFVFTIILTVLLFKSYNAFGSNNSRTNITDVFLSNNTKDKLKIENKYGYTLSTTATAANISQEVINFNDSAEGSTKLEESTVLLCQNFTASSSFNRKAAWDPNTKKCYALNSKGPCDKNMRFYEIPASYGFNNFGLCDCDQRKPAYYNNVTKKCHLLFHREYCSKGQWLVQGGKIGIKCVKNTCLNYPPPLFPIESEGGFGSEEENDPEDVVLYKGKCYRLGDDCEIESKKMRGKIEFATGSLEVICSTSFDSSVNSFSGGGSIPTLKCSQGSRWSEITNSCQPGLRVDLS